MSKSKITLVKNIVNGVDIYHPNIHQIRFYENRLDKNRYLNLYIEETDTKWSSCIECDRVIFNKEKLLLVYCNVINNCSFMHYVLDNIKSYNLIKEVFENENYEKNEYFYDSLNKNTKYERKS